MQKSKLWSHKDHENTFCSIRMHTICRFSWKKRLKMASSWSKKIFFGLRQAVEDPPPILRVLDVTNQVVVTHRSRKPNLQHPYAPKFAIFHEKTANNGHFLVKSWDFWALPYFEGAGCEKADCRDTQITRTQITASVRTKICHFS